MRFNRLLLYFAFLLPSVALSQLKGRVVKVADGDTFTMLVNQKQVRVRLHGIDCPEKGQDFSQVAREYLAALILHREVVVNEMNRDRFGRVIGILLIDGVNVNEKLLQEGLAWHFLRYDRNPEWSAMQHLAKAGKKGLWSHDNAIAPWEFRKTSRKVKPVTKQ